MRENNFDDPGLADYDLLLENIKTLKAGLPCEVPIYDFKTSSRSGYRTVQVPESRIIIVEGIYALNSRLAPLLDLKVAVTGGIHFDLVKRVRTFNCTCWVQSLAGVAVELHSCVLNLTCRVNSFAGVAVELHSCTSIGATLTLSIGATLILQARRTIIKLAISRQRHSIAGPDPFSSRVTTAGRNSRSQQPVKCPLSVAVPLSYPWLPAFSPIVTPVLGQGSEH